MLMVPADSLVAASGEEAIKERKALMKNIVNNWKPIKAYAKGTGTPADVAKHAAALTEDSKRIVALFPKGTGRGDFPDKVTRALPAIWNDWSEFEKIANVMIEESEKLERVAKAGNKEAIVQQIGLTGRLGCGGCHKPFRGAKVK
ncbi:MAG: cytochrome c [Alphaproteobacteria bacterium]|nr:cytochrome c [Alphaproteobacteria bacterium]